VYQSSCCCIMVQFVLTCRVQVRGIVHPWFICWFRCYIYIICLSTSFASPLVLLLQCFPYLSAPLLIFSFESRPLPFQAWCRKRRLNLAFVFLWLPCIADVEIIFSSCGFYYLIYNFPYRRFVRINPLPSESRDCPAATDISSVTGCWQLSR